MVEFTGERVIPGQVNEDLWSEHLSRYVFARRYVRNKHVLDAGCGTGYGTAELAQDAASVIGLDISAEALEYARASYPLPNVTFVAGSGVTLPLTEASVDVVVAFEVIEHLNEYQLFIAECARVLKRNGLLIVSTPNTRYYAESRAASGPNPFHEHEFEASEFHCALRACFGHVTLLLQNRVESFAFHPPKTFLPSDACVQGGGGSIDDAHFFVALCSRDALPELRSFVYVPRAANVLREREQHVVLLEKELAQAKAWLKQTENERNDLLALFHKQKDELEARNRWAGELNEQLATTQARVVELQDELAAVARGYEAQIKQLEVENEAKTEWAMDTEARLSVELEGKCSELAECVRLLDQSEALVEERTHWAQSLEAELNLIRASRWLKLGGKLGLGPARR